MLVEGQGAGGFGGGERGGEKKKGGEEEEGKSEEPPPPAGAGDVFILSPFLSPSQLHSPPLRPSSPPLAPSISIWARWSVGRRGLRHRSNKAASRRRAA